MVIYANFQNKTDCFILMYYMSPLIYSIFFPKCNLAFHIPIGITTVIHHQISYAYFIDWETGSDVWCIDKCQLIPYSPNNMCCWRHDPFAQLIDCIDSLTSFIQNGFYNNYTDMGKKVDQFFSRLACILNSR